MTYRKKSIGAGSVKLRYINEFKDNRGNVRRYFRQPGRPSIPLPGEPGSLEFLDAYRAALANSAPIEIGKEKRSIPGSVSELIAAYYESHAYKSKLSEGTRAGRRGILERFREEVGAYRLTVLEPHHIITRLEKLNPGTARNWLVAIRGLMQYAIETKRLKVDPTADIKSPKALRKADDDDSEEGHATWPEEWIAQYEAYWPSGSKERLMLALPLFTAQRRSDVLRMGPGMVKNGVMTLRQKKTKILVHIPIGPELAEIIAASPCGDMVYLVTNRKGSYQSSSLGCAFRVACDKASLPQEATMHGLRKAWCRRGAEMGMTEDMMMAITGHQTSRQLRGYLQGINRELLAQQAIDMMSRRNAKRT